MNPIQMNDCSYNNRKHKRLQPYVTQKKPRSDAPLRLMNQAARNVGKALAQDNYKAAGKHLSIFRAMLKVVRNRHHE